MLDGAVRRRIDPALDRAGIWLASKNFTANQLTIFAWATGCVATILIASQLFLTGLAVLLVSRLADGLDGAIAKATKPTDFGGYLDIVLDFFFYGAIPLGFVYADPLSNAAAGALLIFSFYFNGATFLAYSVLAEKRKQTTEVRGKKSIYFTTGLAEATETISVFALCCLFPMWFSEIAYFFAAICFYTSFSRIILAGRNFPDTDTSAET